MICQKRVSIPSLLAEGALPVQAHALLNLALALIGGSTSLRLDQLTFTNFHNLFMHAFSHTIRVLKEYIPKA